MIRENIIVLKEKISKAAERSGRKLDEIKIIAVSKNVNLNDILTAKKNGINDFGENKAQEIKEKFEEINKLSIREEYLDASWHFIGHLQTNKVKYVANLVDYVHSVDSIKLCEELNKRAMENKRKIKILLEYKTSDEVSKYGIESEDELLKICEKTGYCDYLELIGLMTMAPFTDDEKTIRKSFKELYRLKNLLVERGYNIQELSMGMTSDYEIAIEEGSTMVRIGTAIFGPRNYTKSWREQ
jgi:hypothetical protein